MEKGWHPRREGSRQGGERGAAARMPKRFKQPFGRPSYFFVVGAIDH